MGWIFHASIFYLINHSITWAIIDTLIMRSLFAPLFVHLAVFNHIGLENPATQLPWLPHQTKTTRNIKFNWFLNGIGGNAFVNCHIEHHLFPKLSNKMLGKIRPTVLRFLKKEGYDYYEIGYWQCLRNCIKYYHEIFSGIKVEI